MLQSGWEVLSIIVLILDNILLSSECTANVKKHDPHSARRLVQVDKDSTEQVDDGVLSSDAGLVSKLKGILMCPDGADRSEMVQDESFQGLCDVGGQCHRL